MRYLFILIMIGIGFFIYPYIEQILGPQDNRITAVKNLQEKQEKNNQNFFRTTTQIKREINSNRTKKFNTNRSEIEINRQKSSVQTKEFADDFSESYILEEAPSMEKSSSNNWWLNSGAYFISQDGTARTLFGELPEGEKWQIKFKNYNPDSTLNGFQPQNIFRLITKSKWKNFEEQMDFKIHTYNAIDAKHRNQSNGVLLFLRYIDSDNLYYAGIRVDGAAVIKKKLQGKYTTLGYKKIFNGNYDLDKNPNLIPLGIWHSIKAKIQNIDTNKVNIVLYVKEGHIWDKVLDIIDDQNPILQEGYAGIRTDFADVEFDNYKIKEIYDR